ncbi:MAG: hypothetical protein JO047_12670 [Alphaproteobacteria bacterium]|nr:hypothetical protein [Alphaproteobacteria bacterium]
MTSIDWRSRAVSAALFLALAAPAAAAACDMHAVDQQLAREQPATPQTLADTDQQPIVLASPSPDNDEAQKSSSNSQGQSNSSGQSSGSSQSTQQR